jgi:hypothetical protein
MPGLGSLAFVDRAGGVATLPTNDGQSRDDLGVVHEPVDGRGGEGRREEPVEPAGMHVGGERYRVTLRLGRSDTPWRDSSVNVTDWSRLWRVSRTSQSPPWMEHSRVPVAPPAVA